MEPSFSLSSNVCRLRALRRSLAGSDQAPEITLRVYRPENEEIRFELYRQTNSDLGLHDHLPGLPVAVRRQGNGAGQEKNISLTQLLNDADQGKISEVTVNGAEVTGHYRDDKTSSTPPSRPTTPTCTRRSATTASTSPSRIRTPNAWVGFAHPVRALRSAPRRSGSSCCARCSPAATRP